MDRRGGFCHTMIIRHDVICWPAAEKFDFDAFSQVIGREML